MKNLKARLRIFKLNSTFFFFLSFSRNIITKIVVESRASLYTRLKIRSKLFFFLPSITNFAFLESRMELLLAIIL